MSIHRRQLLARCAFAAATAPLAWHARAFAGLLTDGTPRASLTAYASAEDARREELRRLLSERGGNQRRED